MKRYIDRNLIKRQLRDNQRLIKVFVEGYEDVAFWRGVFDNFTAPDLCFEISVPTRSDLPKGKKILLGMIPRSSEDMILCVDSDFDHLFEGETHQSRQVCSSEFMFHTYTYATENYLCYAPSLHNVCVKATKNDRHIFDFELFMAAYSETIYPLFLWYSYSAMQESEHIFILSEFRNSVRLGYLELEDNGANTLQWLSGVVARKLKQLEKDHPQMVEPIAEFAKMLELKGVTPELTYLYMHGHTLMDCVVMVCLSKVCETLRAMSIDRIAHSSKTGVALENELSNYKNTVRSIRDVLLDNENYTSCPLYRQLQADIERYISKVTRQ